jgi:uncharacterized iron-regulated membrane protein
MKKIFSKLHLWLSVPFGIFISIVCLTGALLVFEEEINEMNHPELYRVEKSEGNTMSPKALAAIVAKTLPEDTQVTGITISDDPTKTWKVSISKPHHASVAVNPYTGEVLGQISRSEFFNQVMALHRYLLVKPAQRGDMTVGKWIVGASVLALVFILITGLVIWFPFRIGKMKFWRQLHYNGGTYVSLFLLLMALTGLTWSFNWYRTGFYAMFGGEEQRTEVKAEGGKQEGGRPEGGRHEGHRPEFKGKEGEQPAVEGRGEKKSEVRGEGRPEGGRPEGKPEGRGGNPNFHHEGGNPNFHGEGRGEARPDFSELTVKHDNEPTKGVRAWVYQLHTGKWGGLFSKVLYFLACLVGATLPWTGYYFWLRKKSRRKSE